MTSGGNNFNYFPENQLTKSKICPLTSLFLPQRFLTHFASPGVPLDTPAGRTECLRGGWRLRPPVQLTVCDHVSLHSNNMAINCFISPTVGGGGGGTVVTYV